MGSSRAALADAIPSSGPAQGPPTIAQGFSPAERRSHHVVRKAPEGRQRVCCALLSPLRGSKRELFRVGLPGLEARGYCRPPLTGLLTMLCDFVSVFLSVRQTDTRAAA
jgi:hypothetical protein